MPVRQTPGSYTQPNLAPAREERVEVSGPVCSGSAEPMHVPQQVSLGQATSSQQETQGRAATRPSFDNGIPPYTSDLCSRLPRESYPDDMATDDVLRGRLDSDITFEARTCILIVRELICGTRHLGHPIKQYLVRLRRTARCQKEALVYAGCMKCIVCPRRRPPHMLPRAATRCRATRFNHRVGLDLKFMKATLGQTCSIVHSMDLVSMHHMRVLCGVPTNLWIWRTLSAPI